MPNRELANTFHPRVHEMLMQFSGLFALALAPWLN